MIPEINFQVPTPEKVAEFVYSLKESLGETVEDAEENYENQEACIFIPLSKELVRRIIMSKELTDELREEISEIIRPLLNKEKEELDKTLIKIKELWAKINKSYWKEIEKYFPGLIEESYDAYLTNIVCGAYFDGNEVTIPKYKSVNESLFVYVMAEELLHLAYWKFWEELCGKRKEEFMWNSGIEGWNSWNISEAIPEYLLINNPTFKKYGWDKFKRTNSYPWLDKIRPLLDPLWKNKKSFKEFVIKSHKVLGIRIDPR
ncbi:hypothetical protein COU61_01300 [Candidatus Pacearchaeota archaeon CG10_big_fil_rev_8_21_14_0_10_35_13]|nr:MAG: hypothetical protein COU61_01300 [Candidatus Pacearchaeota archaeon CG10_big_fil_rev_8_21_14_0_10_35_13]